jgi:hypothetical protein
MTMVMLPSSLCALVIVNFLSAKQERANKKDEMEKLTQYCVCNCFICDGKLKRVSERERERRRNILCILALFAN